MEATKIIFSNSLESDLTNLLLDIDDEQIFILTDQTTSRLCLPLISGFRCLSKAKHICVGSGDVNKNVESLSHIWKELSDNGATRKALMINVGGGMITDIGGFACSTFKRGMRFIQIPTTVLGAVDASVGGKTGINFNGLKNEVGVFNMPYAVIISSMFFKTLDYENVMSGSAEMFKHGFISNSKYLNELYNLDFEKAYSDDFLKAVKYSVEIKNEITQKDPTEKNIRKVLNFGHTAGHAIESLSHKRGTPILHGYAVAFGMICELYLSVKKCGLKSIYLSDYISFIKDHYSIFSFSCDDYDYLIDAMKHDKKNANEGEINFSLFSELGVYKLNQIVNQEEIKEALDFYQDSLC